MADAVVAGTEAVASTEAITGNEAVAGTVDESTEFVESAEPEFIDLFAGAALGTTDAEVFTRRSRAHVIVFVGAEGSGKTTVLSSIYERLNHGTFAGFKFAGSRSLLGFEEICHLNRLASGGTQPDTQRTQLTSEAKFYHLAIQSVEPLSERYDVLLSAMSGEMFRLAKDSDEDARRLTFLRRADTIVVLVDGERLAAPAMKMSAQADAADILESILDAHMVSNNCRVEVVFSKLDCVMAVGKTALDFLAKSQTKYEEIFRTRVPHLSFRQIAARPVIMPAQENTERGLADAFASWMTVASLPSKGEYCSQPAPAHDDREFSKFGWRHYKPTRRAP